MWMTPEWRGSVGAVGTYLHNPGLEGCWKIQFAGEDFTGSE